MELRELLKTSPNNDVTYMPPLGLLAMHAVDCNDCAILSLENDDTDQIHYETARQSRWALGIGLTIR